MSKKKPQQASEDQNVPAPPTTEGEETRKGSRHKPRNMISVSPRRYELLRQLARRNRRPIAWEARIAIDRALVEAGLLTEEEAAVMDEESE